MSKKRRGWNPSGNNKQKKRLDLRGINPHTSLIHIVKLLFFFWSDLSCVPLTEKARRERASGRGGERETCHCFGAHYHS